MDYRKKLSQLNQRRFDSLTKSLAMSEAVIKNAMPDAERYLAGSMDIVPQKYTDIVLRTGERIRKQLESSLTESVEFDQQGSVTNGTHIRLYSDIDLLVVTKKVFIATGGAYAHVTGYTGDTRNDILVLRDSCKTILETSYPTAKVDSKAKCIGISGGSLERPVDVVPCAWVKNQKHAETNLKFHLGIRLRDVEKREWVDNYPFMHNAMIDYVDGETGGNYRRVVRLLKNLREDADAKIDASSYDICGLVYNCNSDQLKTHYGDSTYQFLDRFLAYSRNLETNTLARVGLKVPNGTRELFGAAGLAIAALSKLNTELDELLKEVRKESGTFGLLRGTPSPLLEALMRRT